MADVWLIRHGSKADLDLKDPETGLPYRYDVVERVRWYEADGGVSLAMYGISEGLYRFGGAEQPFQVAWGLQWPFDYYSLPTEPGAIILDAPHTPSEGE